MKLVWPDSFVEEGNITFTVGLLRKLLEDDVKKPRFIATVFTRGYRFIGDVRRVGVRKKDFAESSIPSDITQPQISRRPYFAIGRKRNIVAHAKEQRVKNSPDTVRPAPKPRVGKHVWMAALLLLGFLAGNLQNPGLSGCLRDGDRKMCFKLNERETGDY